MKLKILILCMLSISIAGCQKKNDKISLPSSWIGTIKMGDANPELVFYLYEDSLGQTAGHLGIPSKGIEKIPFDPPLIIEDSIKLNISAAQASYHGILNKSKKTITGTWKEGENTFSLVLSPLDQEIDYTTSKKASTTSLSLEFTSENFKYYSEKTKKEVLEELSNVLENNYARLTKKLSTRFDTEIDVLIYPDIKTFHKAINYPDAPDWVVGAASKNELKMVSPQNPGSVHTYESLIKAIVHELTHTIVLNFRDNGLVGLPNWLNEGYAYYEAGQLTQEEKKAVRAKALKKEIPSWQELSDANTSEFGNLGGYGISATIIDFLIKTYGIEKLKQYIINPETTEQIYNRTIKDLEQEWLDYIKNNNK
ncbi:peptidase MA family metallohydrolase [Aquimarina rubra]|uniref:Peptidase MA family metallohydrolase n=1 Tax=Aquimarina rubra TaxID=1920033 RepID=A0ABW5LB36_9FLAO